jgi:hypothetical protein
VEVEPPPATGTTTGTVAPVVAASCSCDANFVWVAAHQRARAKLWAQSLHTVASTRSVLFLVLHEAADDEKGTPLCLLDDIGLARFPLSSTTASSNDHGSVRLRIVSSSKPLAMHAAKCYQDMQQPQGASCMGETRVRMSPNGPLLDPLTPSFEVTRPFWTTSSTNDKIRASIRDDKPRPPQTLTVVSWDALPRRQLSSTTAPTGATLHRQLAQSLQRVFFLLDQLQKMARRVHWMGSLQCDCTSCDPTEEQPLAAAASGAKDLREGEQCLVLEAIRARAKECGWFVVRVSTLTDSDGDKLCLHTTDASRSCVSIVYFCLFTEKL